MSAENPFLSLSTIDHAQWPGSRDLYRVESSMLATNRGATKVRPLILRLDITGQPLRWIPWRAAVVLETRHMIAWHAGKHTFTICGGVNRSSRDQSRITVNSIIATKGHLRQSGAENVVPPLSNRELFLRDGHMCLYCGKQFLPRMLTRDHVLPLSQGGQDCWSNVVSACKPCNHAKGARRPEDAGLGLLAVPYVPNRAEYLVLSNRRILVDQMDFLRKRFRNATRLML